MAIPKLTSLAYRLPKAFKGAQFSMGFRKYETIKTIEHFKIFFCPN